MWNPSLINRIYQKRTLGIEVDRVAAADPQNVWLTVFTIAGGLVLVTMLIGQRTVAQAGGASTMQFRHNTGTVQTVLDAGTLSIAADHIGCTYVLSGDPADPIAKADLFAPVFLGKVVASATKYNNGIGLFICAAGTIQVTMTAIGGTGSTGYSIWYMPITDAATIS